MRYRLLAGMVLLLGVAVVEAQDTALTPGDVKVVTETDLYGQETFVAEGTLRNTGSAGYSAISLQADVLDATGKSIGEGIGYLVNACRAGLLPDFVLPPGGEQAFAVTLELDDEEASIGRVNITAQGQEAADSVTSTPAAVPGITSVTSAETVSVEWVDANSLRYAAGCWRDPFTRWQWHDYNLTNRSDKVALHPKVPLVTDALRRQLGLLDDALFNRAFLRYPPDSRRLVYQNDLNKVISAEVDGSYKRELMTGLANRMLQGITWLSQGRFLAYYYGAYGDPVLYFTADNDGQVLSEPPTNNTPSLITPGASPDGTLVVLAASVDENTNGYYLKRAAYPGLTLLFKAEPPGNNWPGPLLIEENKALSRVYVALPSNGAARLACYDMKSQKLGDLGPLPLNLTPDARAGWWLSPDGTRIALAADGADGGLWLIDLNQMKACA
jgi:hypothetical protein